MAEVFALYRDGGFGELPMKSYPLRDAARLHDEVERRVISGLSVLVP